MALLELITTECNTKINVLLVCSVIYHYYQGDLICISQAKV